MKSAYAYLRVSGKSQVSGDGFPRQLKAIRDYAAAHGIKIVHVFREEGISGTVESMDRPAWSELMAMLYSNGVSTILIEKLDRLARDLMVQEAAIADLHKHVFNLLSVAEPDLMATDPTRILVRQMMGAVAQYEKSQIVLKLRGARIRKRAADGRCEGRKPFGYYDGETATLATMQTLWSRYKNLTQVCRELAKAGASSRTGSPWHPYTVSEILKRSGSL